MKVRELRRRAAGTVKAALVSLGLAGLASGAAVSLAAAGAAGAERSQGGQTTTVFLDYHEVGYTVLNSGGGGLRVTERHSACPKEPAFRGSKVMRGSFTMPGGGTNEVAFAWDQSGRKLYVDLNGNLDLSDDPAGVFQSNKSYRDDYQTFTNVHLPFRTAAGKPPMLADLNMNGMRRLVCSVALRSFWEGKVSLQGEDWEVGLVVMPGGQQTPLESGSLLLRPWAERSQPFSCNSYRESSAAFRFPRRLFFGNRAYELQCANVVEGDNPRVRMEFVEQSPKLGEVKITGDFVHRVTMKGKPYFVVLDRPDASVQVPVGTYGQIKAWLKKDGAEAHLSSGSPVGIGNYEVGGKEPARLLVGGPLTNSVSVRRRGRYLSLNYQLLGAAGPYEMENVDQSHPPTFTVYRGDKKVASGKFQYG